jgi:hypothetical protein
VQKYRSHRKHMHARKAEAASWTQRPQMYAAGGTSTAVKRSDSNTLTVPTIGFFPPPPPPPPHYGRPLHVWGHPTQGVELPRAQMWPRHLISGAPTPAWAPPPPSHPAFWHHPYMRVRLRVIASASLERLVFWRIPFWQGPGHIPMPMPAAVRDKLSSTNIILENSIS